MATQNAPPSEISHRIRREHIRATLTSLAIAALSLTGLALLLALLMIQSPVKEIETIITYQAPTTNEQPPEPKKISLSPQQLPAPPAPSFPLNTLVNANTLNQITIPTDAPTESRLTPKAPPPREDFGEDQSFEENMFTETSFFGTKLTGKRICYIIDYSASMRGTRERLMRRELSKSIQKLNNGTQYNLIFFSGLVWQAGNTTTLTPTRRAGSVTDQSGNTYQWIAKSHLQDWQPAGKKQRMRWIRASDQNIQSSLQHIASTPLLYGTRWEQPLRYAFNMNPKPDTVVFMTDGASGKASLEIAKTMSKIAQRRKIPVHTVSLMEPKAKTSLLLLAKKTGGTATMVLSKNKTIDLITGKELNQN